MNANPSRNTKSVKDHQNVDSNKEFAFGPYNYKLLILGLIVIFIGFLLMIGGGSDDPDVFSDKIFNFRRLTLAPVLVLLGYVIGVYAIMKKPKK